MQHITYRLGVCMAMMLMANIQTSYAQNRETPNFFPVENLSELTDGSFNVKQFEVKAETTRDHYVRFWLRPAKHADNQYTTFYVYLNNHYAGTITPDHGNWQEAYMDDSETLRLSKGSNTISIATLAPEMPDVESVKVAQNAAGSQFAADSYEDYLEEAVTGSTYDIPEEGISTFSSSPAGMAFYPRIPLNYSFYSTYSFTEGQQVYIFSDSQAEHCIDVMFYGTSPIGEPSLTSVANNTENTNPASETGSSTIGTPDKLGYYIKYASSEEMQGLNWQGISEKAANSSKQLASVIFTAPKTGIYLVRLRSKENGILSVANLNVNGMYFYENTPVFYACVSCEIPADGNRYATMTSCATPGTDDPILYIQGAGADRLVGVNDDGPSDKLTQYNLSNRDAYISQRYFMKTKRISVSNYNSLNPVSECTILARVYDSEGASSNALQARSLENLTSGISNCTKTMVDVQSDVRLGSSLAISADAEVRSIAVYNLAGSRIGAVRCSGETVSVPLSSVNIAQKGVYLLHVETAGGTVERKILVR